MPTLPAYEDFKNVLNQKFQIMHAEGTMEVALTQISELHQSDGFSSFSIFFSGGGDTPLEQDSYTICNTTLGEHAIFMVPVGRSEQGIEYQAVFSHKQQ